MAEAAHEPQQEHAKERFTIERPTESAVHPVLGLQAAIGNRAVARVLQQAAIQRNQIKDVEVKKRFDLPVRHYSQSQVRALYLGVGIVYSGDATWDEKSKSWIVDRSKVFNLGAEAVEKKDGLPSDTDLQRFENSLEDILKTEPLPKEGTVFETDNFTTAHLNAVKAVINFYLLQAYRASLDENGEPTMSVLMVTKLAARNLTAKRQQSDLTSQSLILRDAQRYFYGRLAAFSDIDAMKAKAFQGTDPTLSKDPALMSEEERKKGERSAFLEDPDTTNIQKMKDMQSDYESLKQLSKFFGSDINVSKHPSSAPGGRWWLDKGANDSYSDMKERRYKQNALPTLVR